MNCICHTYSNANYAGTCPSCIHDERLFAKFTHSLTDDELALLEASGFIEDAYEGWLHHNGDNA